MVAAIHNDVQQQVVQPLLQHQRSGARRSRYCSRPIGCFEHSNAPSLAHQTRACAERASGRAPWATRLGPAMLKWPFPM